MHKNPSGPRARRVNAWLCAAILGALWTYIPITASADDQVDDVAPADFALQMSPSISWETTGELPTVSFAPATDIPAEPVAEAAPLPTATPVAIERSGVSGLTALLLTLLGAVAGALLTRRAPRDQTPAQDRLAGELSRLRERYLNVLAQREQRRDHAWESTVTSLRNDVASARALLDNQRDQCAAFQNDMEAQQRDIELLTRQRDDFAGQLDHMSALHDEAQRKLADTTARKQTLEDWHSSTQEENRTLVTRLQALEAEAADAQQQRERVAELESDLTDTAAAAAQVQASLEPMSQENAQAQQRLAEMLDKNLALEAELARLKERLAIVDNAHARQVADLLDERRNTEQDRAQREVTLQNQLREANASFVKREAELNERSARLQDQLTQADEAKRRVLTLLRQEKTDSAEAFSELESLRVDHAHTLEQFDSVQSMLGVAEDRIEVQGRQLDELQEENEQLRREIEQRDTGEFQRVSRQLKALRVDHDGITVREHMHDDKLLRTIEQLTRSRDAAVEELTRLKALQMPVTDADSTSVREAHSLNEARMSIRSLEADLRVRGDLIDALRNDIERLRNADTRLDEKDAEIARLRNELSMALDETSRLRKIEETAERLPPRDILRLRERLDALQERLELKEKEIAILRTATGTEHDESPLHEHVSRLEADQEASVTVIRFLESEVEKLSRELRASGSSN